MRAVVACVGLLASLCARPDAIDEVIHHAMTQAHIPGAAVAIVRDGKITRVSTYGIANNEYRVAVTPATAFQIASATKLYTSVLLMRLVEQHKLNLDDSVTQYIHDAPESWRDITVRHLATHTSGLGGMEINREVVATADAVKLAFAIKIAEKPGTRADYDSLDFTLLQFILEEISGKPFAQLLKEELLAPAGMSCTSFDNAEDYGPQRVADDVPNRAEYYRWMANFNQRRWFLYPKYAYAAGGAYSCIHDMAIFLAQIDSGTLLSTPSLSALQTPARLNDGSKGEFGIGWATGSYRGRRWVGHSGGPAFSDVKYFPDDHLGIIVFTNQQRLHPDIAALIADELITAPAGYTSGGLPDRDPGLTTRARKLLEGVAAGRIDGSLLASTQSADYIDDLNGVGPVWLGLFGPITKLMLVSDEITHGGARQRRYRVVFGRHVLAMNFMFDKTGKILEIDPAGD